MKSPLPLIGQVYSLLLQDETQRDIHSPNPIMSDSASLKVNSSRNYGSSYGSGQFTTGSSNSLPKKSGTDTRKLHCNYCKKPGHVIDKYYKLHGFPADFKFTKPKRVGAQVELSNQNTTPTQPSQNSS